MSKLQEIPKRREVIQQNSLRNLSELLVLHRRVVRQIEQKKQEIMEGLLADAEIEPGMHTAELMREWRNGTLVYSLEVY